MEGVGRAIENANADFGTDPRGGVFTHLAKIALLQNRYAFTNTRGDCTRLRILLTGCVGFIGARVASLLLDAGHEVAGMDALCSSFASRLQEWRLGNLTDRPGFTFYRVDIRDIEASRGAFTGHGEAGQIAAVINLGALAGVRNSVEDPRAYYEVNVLGTLNLLELCREYGVGKFTLASTSSVYGTEIDGPVSEDDDSNRPLSPYAASKKAAETLLHSYHHLYGIDAVVLRYFTVYGPAGRPDMSVFRFIRAVAEGEPITVYGDGTQQRDFTFVDDVALGTVTVLEVSGYETLNLGHGSPVVLNDVIRLIEEGIGRPAEIRHRERHPADPIITWADNSRARDLLVWTPSVGIEEGIRRTIDWYRAHRHWAKKLS